MRTMAVDMGELINALTASPEQEQWYFDLQTGKLIFRLADMGLWDGDGDDDEVVLEDNERFFLVHPLETCEQFRIMEGFAATVDEPEIRDQLARALSGRGAFSRFRDAVFPHADVSAKWNKYHRDAVEEEALHLLEAHDINPLYTLPEIEIPEATAPAKESQAGARVDMLAMLLFGAPEGEIQPIEGVAVREYHAPNPGLARNVFKRVAREACVFAGIPWRKRFAQNTNVFEAGAMTVLIRDCTVELRVKVNTEVWKAFSR